MAVQQAFQRKDPVSAAPRRHRFHSGRSCEEPGVSGGVGASQATDPRKLPVCPGTVRRDERAPSGYELDVEDIEIIQIAEEYPIALKKHGVDFLMDHRHLWIRTPRQRAILKIRAEIIRAVQDWLDGKGSPSWIRRF